MTRTEGDTEKIYRLCFSTTDCLWFSTTECLWFSTTKTDFVSICASLLFFYRFALFLSHFPPSFSLFSIFLSPFFSLSLSATACVSYLPLSLSVLPAHSTIPLSLSFSPSFSLSQTFCLFFSPPLSPSLSHIHTLSLPRARALALCEHACSFSLSLSLYLTPRPPPVHTHTNTHTHTHTSAHYQRESWITTVTLQRDRAPQ